MLCNWPSNPLHWFVFSAWPWTHFYLRMRVYVFVSFTKHKCVSFQGKITHFDSLWWTRLATYQIHILFFFKNRTSILFRMQSILIKYLSRLPCISWSSSQWEGKECEQVSFFSVFLLGPHISHSYFTFLLFSSMERWHQAYIDSNRLATPSTKAIC